MSELDYIIAIIIILFIIAIIFVFIKTTHKFSERFNSNKILKAPSCEECGSLTNENAKRMCLEGCQLDTCYKECSGKKSRPECILECITNGNNSDNGNYNGYNNSNYNGYNSNKN